MDAKKFVLTYYKNATENFHITRLTAPQEALNLHSHNYYQIYYLVSGTIRHHVGNSTAKMTAGDVFILPPNLPHYIEVPDGDADFYSMSFTPDYFNPAREGNKLVLDFLYYLREEKPEVIQPKISLHYEDSAFTEILLSRIMGEFLGTHTGNQELIKACVSALLSVFARVYFEENAEALRVEENKHLVMHCITYIKNHFDEELTLSEMVHLSAMSKTCFCTIFRSITGTTFKDYLSRCRIEKAVELIREGEKISAVSIRCGYNDLSTFYRNFVKYKGISPNAYAAEHGQAKKKKATGNPVAQSAKEVSSRMLRRER